MLNKRLTRRQYLQSVSATATTSIASRFAYAGDASIPVKKVAAVVTAYQKGLHADVLLGKLVRGWDQNGGPGPALELASMYVEQIGPKDLSRGISKRYGIPMFDNIEGAVTVGKKEIPVDGVICIGEHGKYPYNDKGQHLYPRRRFFKGITDTFEKYKRVVPVFHDKHLGPEWKDAKWMYEKAKELNIPFMAGSSLPVTFRKPDFKLPMGSDIELAVGVGYSGLDIYGSHTLDCFQCLVERRKGAEKGVRSVQCLEGDALWNAIDSGRVDKAAFEAALSVVPRSTKVSLRECQASLFLFEYHDGFPGAVVMLPGHAGGISTAVKLKGNAKPLATRFEERAKPYYPHFAYLLKSVERMIHTGRPSYPVERCYLTSGILDRALTSRHEEYKRLITPELSIAYQPVDYPHAPHTSLSADPRKP